MLEMGLDGCNSIIFKRLGGSKLEHKLPRPLKQRLQFFRRCLNRIDALKSIQARGLACADRISALKQFRHNSIHGFMLDYDAETGTIERSELALI